MATSRHEAKRKPVKNCSIALDSAFSLRDTFLGLCNQITPLVALHLCGPGARDTLESTPAVPSPFKRARLGTKRGGQPDRIQSPIPRTAMKPFISLGSHLLAAVLFGGALLMVPIQRSTAQADRPPSLIEHLRNDLRSDHPIQRERALVDVIALAGCGETCTVSLQSIEEKKLSIANETGTGAVVELTNLVPDLLEVYRSGPADGQRLLALSALVNIGDLKALERLVEDGSSQSKKTMQATHSSLAAFYLDKYPELTEQTVRTKRLSLEDVRRAEALRIRKLKKN